MVIGLLALPADCDYQGISYSLDREVLGHNGKGESILSPTMTLTWKLGHYPTAAFQWWIDSLLAGVQPCPCEYPHKQYFARQKKKDV